MSCHVCWCLKKHGFWSEYVEIWFRVGCRVLDSHCAAVWWPGMLLFCFIYVLFIVQVHLEIKFQCCLRSTKRLISWIIINQINQTIRRHINLQFELHLNCSCIVSVAAMHILYVQYIKKKFKWIFEMSKIICGRIVYVGMKLYATALKRNAKMQYCAWGFNHGKLRQLICAHSMDSDNK